ncbi:MAG: isochorismatase family protein [Pedosphaera sp.]|nr:isochorismatase family protein [Pedosphaera sp.]
MHALLSRFLFLSTFLFISAFTLTAADNAHELLLRTRQQAKAEDGSFSSKEGMARWDARKTALVVCDMWDKHWCAGATRRGGEMAPRMNQVVNEARRRGVLIIHAPSDTMANYEATPQRKLAQAAPVAAAKVPLQPWCRIDLQREAALPIDDSDGGCDCEPRCKNYRAWNGQTKIIEIKEGDAVTDSAEAYNLMQQRGIENVIVLGVHVNMCVLGRPFSIRQMVYQGKNVVLMRDMTDAMYNPRARPFVDHCRGNEMVVEHIEKYWCPTVTSSDFIAGAPFAFKEDKRPHVVFVISEPEYKTEETLPAFARSELESRGLRCTFVYGRTGKPNEFPEIAAVKTADLLVLSVRRQIPSAEQLEFIRAYLKLGKPLVGIRTASHAFHAGKGDVKAGWPTFDVEILGGRYEGHYGKKANGPSAHVKMVADAAKHPVLAGVTAEEFAVTSHLYKNRDLAKTVTILLTGRVDNETEPAAWVNTGENRRVFYTSLGNPDDFALPAFRRLLLNAVFWSLGKPVTAREGERVAGK